MSLARATLLLLALTLLSRVLGVVREMAVAWRFGVSSETDAFFVAFSIPYAFYAVVGSSLSAVVVPLLAEYEARGQHEEAARTASFVINFVLLVIGALSVFGMLCSSQIAWLLGGGFDEATLSLAARYTAMMMPSTLFMSLAGVAAGILNHRNVFGPPAFGPVVMNLVIIGGITIGGAWAGIHGLVVGTVLGAISFMIVQLPALHKIGYRHRWVFNIEDIATKRIWSLIWPVMLVSSLSLFYMLIDFRLASNLPEGSISALNYAWKLIQLPQGLFVIAVTTAIFPTLSRLASEARLEEMKFLLQKGVRVIVLLALPGTLIIMIIGSPLVSLLFERGAFDAQDTAITGGALLFLAIGLLGFSMSLPLIRAFYALGDRRTPLVFGLFSVILKSILSLVLIDSMSHKGLALATSVSVVLYAAVLAALLQFRLPRLFERSFFSFLYRVALAAGCMGFTIYLVDVTIEGFVSTNIVASAARIVVSIFVGIVVLLWVAWILQIQEVRQGIKRVESYIFVKNVR